jgi:hypothetical protein
MRAGISLSSSLSWSSPREKGKGGTNGTGSKDMDRVKDSRDVLRPRDSRETMDI